MLYICVSSYSRKNGQLAAKDRQIADLTAALIGA
jgi:hypothetical protein